MDRVELTLGSLLKAPEEGLSGSLIMPPSVPGLEGLTGPIQQLAMHFMNHSGGSQSPQGKIKQSQLCKKRTGALTVVKAVTVDKTVS